MFKTVLKSIVWKNNIVRIIDQTVLPGTLRYENCRRVSDVWGAIKKLKVRGAPLIGIAGALGFLLGIQKSRAKESGQLLKEARRLKNYLASSRPTAVNLSWALNRMLVVVESNRQVTKDKLLVFLKREADAIIGEDIAMCVQMGRFGAKLIRPGMRLLTICNAGALATSGYGTALGVFYRAKEEHKKIKVYACETRPLLQGARLTVWELQQGGVDVTLICDNTAASLMRQGRIDAVFVGADRIAANGDFANKIGTYNLAVLAKYHRIPFYCVAPFSTFDLTLVSGSQIPIEERDREEVACLYFKKPIVSQKTKVFNPAFDVTPANLVTAIITEQGIIRHPSKRVIGAVYAKT